jgi:3-isopropylmalate dehydrogenase
MLLRNSLNQQEAANAIERAVQKALEDGWRTADIAAGKPSIGTVQMGDVVCKLIETA